MTVPNPDPYWITTTENDRTLEWRAPLPDPFVRHTVYVRGWRNALRVLFRRYKLTVTVDGDSERVEQVMEVDPDYLGPPGSASRDAWDARLNDALHNFGASA